MINPTVKKFGLVFSQLVLYFFIYSFLGWVWESSYCSITEGSWVSRGFLIGPYIPVYGFGVLLMLYFVHPYLTKNIVWLFVISTLVVTTLEFLTGLGLEKILHLQLWDYSGYFLNIKGIVCLPVSLFWGLCCVFIIKVLQPRIEILVHWLFDRFSWHLPAMLFVLLVSDTAVSLARVLRDQHYHI